MKSCLCGNGLNKENVIWTHLYLMTRSSVKCAERRRFAPSFIHFFTFYFWKPVFYYCCILEPSRRLREGGNEMLSPGLLRAFFFFFFLSNWKWSISHPHKRPPTSPCTLVQQHLCNYSLAIYIHTHKHTRMYSPTPIWWKTDLATLCAAFVGTSECRRCTTCITVH